MTAPVPDVPEWVRAVGELMTPDPIRGFLDDCFDYLIDSAKVFKDDAGEWQTNEEWDLCVFIHWAQEAAPTDDERRCLIDKLRAYLNDRQDVNDGDYGFPEPNKAMSLLTQLDEAEAA